MSSQRKQKTVSEMFPNQCWKSNMPAVSWLCGAPSFFFIKDGGIQLYEVEYKLTYLEINSINNYKMWTCKSTWSHDFIKSWHWYIYFGPASFWDEYLFISHLLPSKHKGKRWANFTLFTTLLNYKQCMIKKSWHSFPSIPWKGKWK